MSYDSEFPIEYHPSPRLVSKLESLGFEDMSWHNDLAPNWIFSSDWISLCLFIHPEDPGDREDGGVNLKRFSLSLFDDSHGLDENPLIETENWGDMLAVLEGDMGINVETPYLIELKG